VYSVNFINVIAWEYLGCFLFHSVNCIYGVAGGYEAIFYFILQTIYYCYYSTICMLLLVDASAGFYFILSGSVRAYPSKLRQFVAEENRTMESTLSLPPVVSTSSQTVRIITYLNAIHKLLKEIGTVTQNCRFNQLLWQSFLILYQLRATQEVSYSYTSPVA